MPLVSDTILPTDTLRFLSRHELETLVAHVEKFPDMLHGIALPDGMVELRDFGTETENRLNARLDAIQCDLVHSIERLATVGGLQDSMERVNRSAVRRKRIMASLPQAVSRNGLLTMGLCSRVDTLKENVAGMTRDFLKSREHLSASWQARGLDLVRLCAFVSAGRRFLEQMRARDPDSVETRVLACRIIQMECTVSQNLELARHKCSEIELEACVCADLQMGVGAVVANVRNVLLASTLALL